MTTPTPTVLLKPMLFSGPMILRLLDGSKTQTRRVAKPQPSPGFIARGVVGVVPQWPIQNGVRWFMADGMSELVASPYGAPGDQLWVKETFSPFNGQPFYRADDETKYPDDGGWKPSIFMPKEYSRITLEITGVRVERLQSISEEDAKAEGCNGGHDSIPEYNFSATPREHFKYLWESINGKTHPWASSPWVWVYEFRRIKP